MLNYNDRGNSFLITKMTKIANNVAGVFEKKIKILETEEKYFVCLVITIFVLFNDFNWNLASSEVKSFDIHETRIRKAVDF